MFGSLKMIQSFDNPETPLFLVGILFALGMTFLYSIKLISSKYVLEREGVSINILIFFISLFICLFLFPFISFESISGAGG